MTPDSCANGTERCAAVLSALGTAAEIVVNLQGDAPLTPAWFVTACLDRVRGGRDSVRHGDAGDPLQPGAAPPPARRSAPRAGSAAPPRSSPRTGARSISRSACCPICPQRWRTGSGDLPVFLHIGVYAYRRAALPRYAAAAPSAYEQLEGLEQLRFLDIGAPVAVVEVAARGRDIWELNNPHDAGPIEAELARLGVA